MSRGLPRSVIEHAARLAAWFLPGSCQACSPGSDRPGHSHGQAYQLLPGEPHGPELTVVTGGRASGKTRSSANWASLCIAGIPGPGAPERNDGFILGPTFRDVRRTLIEGPSGLLSVLPEGIVTGYDKADLTITTIYGTTVRGIASSAIERVRGPEGSWAWGDEIAFWNGSHLPKDHPASPWSTLVNALRLGTNQKVRLSGTPRPIPLVRELLDQAGALHHNMPTLENLYLPTQYRAMAQAAVESGSPLGRQEFLGEVIDTIEGARWSGQLLALVRLDDVRDEAAIAKDLERVTVAVDPNTVGGDGRDTCGILVGGVDPTTGQAVILADHTDTYPAERWPMRVAEVAIELGATRVVIESDQGGAMPRMLVSRALGDLAPGNRVQVRSAWASKRSRDDVTKGQSAGAKWARAIHTSGYYGSVAGTEEHPTLVGGKVRQLAGLTDLEVEQTTYVHDSKWSPGRLDALAILLRDLLGKATTGTQGYTPPPSGKLIAR